jgi:hypothetical protein
MERSRVNQSAFSTTFQGQPQEETQTPKKKECLCGEQHLFRDCPYLVQELQTAGWKPDPTIKEQVSKYEESKDQICCQPRSSITERATTTTATRGEEGREENTETC